MRVENDGKRGIPDDNVSILQALVITDLYARATADLWVVPKMSGSFCRTHLQKIRRHLVHNLDFNVILFRKR